MKIDDKDIVAAIKKGDNAGYSLLFNKHKRVAFNFIHQRVWDYYDAEDLTMVTFEKAFEKLDKWKPNTCKFLTWLITIAKNTVIDFIIAQQRKLSGGDDIDNYKWIPDNNYPSPYQELIHSELQALIEGRINRLPKKSKPVMQMHVIGYTDEEIAEKLSMMHGNVRCIISRAKTKLKEQFKPLLYEDDVNLHSIAV